MLQKIQASIKYWLLLLFLVFLAGLLIPRALYTPYYGHVLRIPDYEMRKQGYKELDELFSDVEDNYCGQLPLEYLYKNSNFVVDSSSDYQRLVEYFVDFEHEDCKHFRLPWIDFSRYTLLAAEISYGVCDRINREVIRDDAKKEVVYKSTGYRVGGYCDASASLGVYWALVPKVPDNYKVKFSINEMAAYHFPPFKLPQDNSFEDDYGDVDDSDDSNVTTTEFCAGSDFVACQ